MLDKSATALVADDHEAARRLAAKFLERLGYGTVLQAEHGAEAVSLYREHAGEIDLVLLDLRMPVMGGADALRGIVAFDPGARVLMWSGDATDEEVAELLAAGAVAFLQKPVTFEQLSEVLGEILRG